MLSVSLYGKGIEYLNINLQDSLYSGYQAEQPGKSERQEARHSPKEQEFTHIAHPHFVKGILQTQKYQNMEHKRTVALSCAPLQHPVGVVAETTEQP